MAAAALRTPRLVLDLSVRLAVLAAVAPPNCEGSLDLSHQGSGGLSAEEAGCASDSLDLPDNQAQLAHSGEHPTEYQARR